MAARDIKTLGSFVWSIAELLRGDFKQSEYGKVILPFVVLRRLDCILEPTKPAVLDRAKSLPKDSPKRWTMLLATRFCSDASARV